MDILRRKEERERRIVLRRWLNIIIPCYKWVITAAALVMAAGAMLLLWLSLEPRSLPLLTQRLEDALSTPAMQIDIADTIVSWRGWGRGLSIRMVDIDVVADTQSVLSFPEASIALDMAQLLQGNLVLRDLLIENPVLQIARQADASPQEQILVGPRPLTFYQRLMIDILQTIKRNGNQIPLHNLHMRNMKMLVNSGQGEIVWDVEDLSVRFVVLEEKVGFRSSVSGIFNDEIYVLTTEGFLQDQQQLELHTELNSAYPAMIADVFPEIAWLKQANIAMSGEVDVIVRSDGKLLSMRYDVSADKYVPNSGGVVPMEIAMKGTVGLHYNYPSMPVVPEIDSDITIKQLSVEYLRTVWPKRYVPDARKWFFLHVPEGLVTDAIIHVHITPEEIINGAVKKESLQAHVAFEQGVFTSPEHESIPEIQDVSGTVMFDGVSVDVALDEAKAGETLLNNGRVKIFDLGRATMNLAAGVEVEGDVQNIASFSLLAREFDDEMTLPFTEEELKDISGQMAAKVTIQMPLHAEVSEADVEFVVSGDVRNLTVLDVAEGVSLYQGEFHMEIDKSKAVFEGRGLLNTINADMTYTEDMEDGVEYPSRYTVRTHATLDELQSLGMSTIPNVSGPVSLEMDIKENAQLTEMNIVANAAAVSINRADIGWKKPADEALTVTTTFLEAQDGSVSVENIEIKGDKTHITGKGMMHNTRPEFAFVFDAVKFNQNDTALFIERLNQGYKIRLKGERVNLGPLFTHLASEGSNVWEHSLDISLSSSRLLMANGVVLENASGALLCSPAECTEAHFKGKFAEGGEVSLFFGVEDDADEQQRFILNADNAGAFLRGGNVIQYMKGGTIEATATSPIGKHGLFEGDFKVNDFSVVKAPMLTRLLTLGSFTGVVELLNGKGISFEKLKGRFAVIDDVVHFRKVKASGDSLGMTASGEVDMNPGGKIDLRGAVIPAYTINSVLGNIPLIGEWLVGRKGEGVIATRYSMTGAPDNPNITVNPFSMLTPGFLRKIWEGDDEGKDLPEE